MNVLDNEFRQNGLPLVRHPFLIMGSLGPGRPVHFRDTEGVTATGFLGGEAAPSRNVCQCCLSGSLLCAGHSLFGHQGETFKRGQYPCPSHAAGMKWAGTREVRQPVMLRTAPPAMPTCDSGTI